MSILAILLSVGLGVLAYYLPLIVNKPGPLEKEQGRRTARQRIRKSQGHYESLGVLSFEEYYINSRGVELFSKQWLPRDGVVRGVVFYCHGYGDTCTYFWDDAAVRLAQAQYMVVGMDYEGFGLSQGIHGYIPRFDTLVDDVIEFADALQGRPEIASLPFFIFGESMGGAVAIKTHWKRPHSWRGAVFLAPMVKLEKEFFPPPLVVTILRLLSHVIPTWKLVPQRDLADLGFKDPHKRYLAATNPVAYGEPVRLRTASEIMDTAEEIEANMSKVSLPFIVLHGDADVITNASMSRALYEAAASQDKTLKLYEGAWHGLLSGEPDEDVEKVLRDIVSWLDAHSGAGVRRLQGPVSPVGALPEERTLAHEFGGEDAESAVTTRTDAESS